MKLVSFDQVELEDVNVEGAKGAHIRWLISQKDNAPNFALRMFEIEVGGQTPFHKHPWEHEVFVLEGNGALVTDLGEKEFKRYDVIYVDPSTNHQFKNIGETTMKFLCIIPHEPNKVENKKKAVNPFASGQANNC